VDSTKNDRGAIKSEKEQVDQVEVFREEIREGIETHLFEFFPGDAASF